MPKMNPQALIQYFVQDPNGFLTAETQNILVQLKMLEADIARSEVSLRESEHYPTVNLGGYYSQTEGTNYAAQKFDNQVIYVEVSLPLYQGGATESRIRESKATLESIEQQITAQTRETRQAIEKALSNLTSISERLKAIQNAIQSGKIYLDSIEEGFRLGLRDISEVSRAKAQLLANQREQIRNQIDFMNSLVNLYAQTGQLTIQTFSNLEEQLTQKTSVKTKNR
jgi:outer membrane protein